MFIKLRLLASHPTQTKAGKEADYKSTHTYTQLTTARSISTALIVRLTFQDATENAMISTNAEDAAFTKRYRVGNSGILKQQSIYSINHPFSHSFRSCLLSHHRKGHYQELCKTHHQTELLDHLSQGKLLFQQLH